MFKKDKTTQSMQVSVDEKLAIEVIAARYGMKPATFARQLFFRGLDDYLKNPSTGAQAKRLESDIMQDLTDLIDSNEQLSKLRSLIEQRRLFTNAEDYGKSEVTSGERAWNRLKNPSKGRAGTSAARVEKETDEVIRDYEEQKKRKRGK